MNVPKWAEDLRILFFSLLCLIFFSSTSHAEWVLYDDFSGSDWTEKWHHGSEGAHEDLTWVEEDGVLRIIKSVGTVDISKENGTRCRISPDSLPAEANGFRYDIRVVAASGGSDSDTFKVRGKINTTGGTFNFGSGDEECERESKVDICGYNVVSSPWVYFRKKNGFESFSTGSYLEMLDALYFLGGDTMSAWSTVSLQHSEKDAYIEHEIDSGEEQYYYSRNQILDASETGMSDPYVCIRVDEGSANAIFEVQVDNVYYHIGEFDPGVEEEGETRTVVIPLL